MPEIYDELRSLAGRHLRQPSARHGLQPTEVVHEVYLRLARSKQAADWCDRTHFFAVSARALRQILVDEARRARAARRGGDRQALTLDTSVTPGHTATVDLLELDEALSRLARLSERQVRIVELRFFAGLNVGEVAQELGVSRRTVQGDWSMARAWLRRALSGAGE